MIPHYDAVVIGAGPAGSAAATLLATAGRRVLLVEKDRFPRSKVCGEFLSAQALPLFERLGVARQIEACGPEEIRAGRLELRGGSSVAFRLNKPALGLSRYRLDYLLAAHAQVAGAQVWFGTRVLSASPQNGGFRIQCAPEAHESEVRAAAVIGAWGRWDALDRNLGRSFLGDRARYFGWSRDYENDPALAGEVRLYAFRGGYCGLSRVEGGTVNLAGVVSASCHKRLGSSWDAVMVHARRENSALNSDLSTLSPGPIGFLGTGPVFFTRKPCVERGILMAGDAAGFLDPFSGQGQTMALASGMLAAETIERALGGEIPLEALPGEYARAWRLRFARRFGWSAVFRSLMLNPVLASAAAWLGGDRLVQSAILRLQNQSDHRSIGSSGDCVGSNSH
jgi:flavin-dependent dehydrogenase